MEYKSYQIRNIFQDTFTGEENINSIEEKEVKKEEKIVKIRKNIWDKIKLSTIELKVVPELECYDFSSLWNERC